MRIRTWHKIVFAAVIPGGLLAMCVYEIVRRIKTKKEDDHG